MSYTDKNKAMIDYLLTCDLVKNSALYFNYINAKDNTKLIYPVAENTFSSRKFVDGTVLKTYACTMLNYKSVSDSEIIQIQGYANENVTEMLDMQGVINWIAEQNESGTFPDFGSDCIVESIKTTTDTPNIDGYTDQTRPALIQYSITINVEYLDTSKQIWN